MIIKSKCGKTLEVSDDHYYISKGTFHFRTLLGNAELDYDFLLFLFHNSSQTPSIHAEMAHKFGLTKLAKNTLLSRIDEFESVPNSMRKMFVWHELPDRLAVQILEDASPNDFAKIVDLKYQMCYKKFAWKYNEICSRKAYKNLSADFLDTVMETIGPEKTFIMCCANGYLEMAQKMAPLCDNITSTGYLALECAAFEGCYEIVQYLVSLGVDARLDNDWIMRLAAELGYVDIVTYLVSLGADIRAENDHAVKYAAARGHVLMVKYLVSLGADIRADNDWAVRIAAGRGHLDMVRYLVSIGANIRAKNDWALEVASKNRHSEVVDFLISVM